MCVHLPTYRTDPKGHCVVAAVDPDSALCLASRDRVPFLLSVEVLRTGQSGWGSQMFECADDDGGLPRAPTTSPHTVPLSGGAGEAGYGEELLESVFGEPWRERRREARGRSPHARRHPRRCAEEQLAMQFLRELAAQWRDDGLSELADALTPYDIIILGRRSAIVEVLADCANLHDVKSSDGYTNLLDFLCRAYGAGAPDQPPLEQVRLNFTRSTAAYSVLCYLLRMAPFKLTREMCDPVVVSAKRGAERLVALQDGWGATLGLAERLGVDCTEAARRAAARHGWTMVYDEFQRVTNNIRV
eukprot:gene5922-23149_t